MQFFSPNNISQPTARAVLIRERLRHYLNSKTIANLERAGVVLLFILLAFIISTPFRSPGVYAANSCVWTGAVNSSWDTAGNWTSCGGVAPAAEDTVTFNGTYNVAANINSGSTVTIAGLAIASGYTQTITHSQILVVNGAFSQADGTFTGGSAAITVTGNFTLSGGAFTSTSGTFSVGGSWSRTAGTFTHSSGTVTFTSTSAGQTMTAGGQSYYNLTFNGAGGGWALQDTLAATGTITLTAGSLNTNSQTVTCGTFNSSNANTRGLTLGASSITVTGATSAITWNLGTTTGLTFDAGTSTITLSGGSGSIWGGFNGGAKTYSTVALTGSGTPAIWSANTFASLTRTGTAVKTDGLYLRANQTITGTLTLTGNSVANRLMILSDTVGTQRTLDTAAVTASNTNFNDIAGAGVASWNLSAASGGSGNALGNSGITFTTPGNQYWVGNGGNWSDVNHWASSSGGTAATGRVPLPQDNANIDASSVSSVSQTVTADMPSLGANIDFSGVANSPTFSYNIPTVIYGSLTYATGLGTISGSYLTVTFASRSASTISTAGKTLSNNSMSWSVNGPGGAYTLLGNLSTNYTFNLFNGTFNANNYNVAVATYNIATGGTARTLTMGSGTWTASGTGTVWNMGSSGTTTLNQDTSTITFSDTSATQKTFGGGGKTYYNFLISNAGTGAIVVTGANTFHDFTVTGAAKTVTLPASTTTTLTGDFNVTGTASYTVTLNSSSAGTAATLSKTSGTVSVDYLSIRDSTAAGGANWYAGANSTSVSGNTGWNFSAPPVLDFYWVGGDGNWSSASHWANSSGGAGGVGTPSNTDDVIFDTNSASSAVAVDTNTTIGSLSTTVDYGGTITGGTATIGIVGDFTLAGGALTSTSGTMSVGGNWFRTGGAFTHNSGTVAFTATSAGKTITTGGQSFSGLTFSGSGGGWALQDTTTILGNLTLTAGTLNANNQNIALTGGLSVASGAGWTKGSGTLTLNGASQNLSDANSTPNDLGAVATSGTGTATLTGNLRVTTMSIGNGTTLNLGTGSYTLTITGTGTAITTNTSGTFAKGTGSTVNYTGIGTATNVVTLAYNNLSFNPSSSTTYSLTGHLTSANALTGGITIGANATLDASTSNYNITMTGNWSNSGGFTAQNGTVTLNGTNQTLSGNTTFNNLTKQVTSAYSLTFTASSTQTVSGTLTLNGAAGNLLSLRSSVDNSQWSLILNGSGSVSYANVKDSNMTVSSIAPVNCANGGNNSALWLFPINVGVSASLTGSCVASSTSLASLIVGDCLTFNGSASGSIALYEWDFDGNGTFEWSSASTGVKTHYMPIVGTFTPRFKVNYSDGSSIYSDSASAITVSARGTTVNQLEKTGLLAGMIGSSTYTSSNAFDNGTNPFYVAPDGSYALYGYLTPGNRGVAELHIAQSGESPGDPWLDVNLRTSQMVQDPPYDSHFNPTIGVDEQGYIHVFGAMHNQPWAYWRSNSPNTVADGFENLGANTSSIDSDPNYVTVTRSYRDFDLYMASILPGSYISYPRIFQDDNGKIYMTWRGRDTDWERFDEPADQRTHEGYTAVGVYNSAPGVRAWSYPADSGTYTNTRGAAANIAGQIVRDHSNCVGKAGLTIEPSTSPNAGRIHLFWVWGKYNRSWDGTGGTDSGGYDLSHAQSNDGGLTWEKTNGTDYTLPITSAQAEILVPDHYSPHLTFTSDTMSSALTPQVDNDGNIYLYFYDNYYSTYGTKERRLKYTAATSSWAEVAMGDYSNGYYVRGAVLNASGAFESVRGNGDNYASTDGLNGTNQGTISWGITSPSDYIQNKWQFRNENRKYYLILGQSRVNASGDNERDVYFIRRTGGTAVNRKPVLATVGSQSTSIDTPVSVTLRGTDLDSDAMTYAAANLPTGASFDVNTKVFSWTPTAGQVGLHDVTFSVTDGSLTDTETVTFSVSGAHAPVANAQSVSMNVNVATDITLTGYDSQGHNLSYSIATQPAHGELSGSAPNLTYTPTTDYTGADTFTFTVNDGSADSTPATVSITISTPAPGNNAPTANSQSVSTTEGVAKAITLTGFDPDNDSLTYAIVAQPTNGTLSGTPPNVTYTPNSNYSSSESFTFRVYDGTEYSTAATVTVTVIADANNVPSATAQSVSVNQDTDLSITLSGTDADDDSLTYSVASQPSHGTLIGTAPNLTYRPTARYDGADSFAFKVYDGNEYSGLATITVTVNNTNHAPVATSQSVAATKDSAASITLAGSDADSDTLTYTIVSQPAHGTLSGDAPNLTYTPEAGFTGSDSFTFTTNDSQDDSSVATVTITVSAVPTTAATVEDATISSGDTVENVIDRATSRILSRAQADARAASIESSVSQETALKARKKAPSITQKKQTPAARAATTVAATAGVAGVIGSLIWVFKPEYLLNIIRRF